jgi:acetyl esterase
LKNETARILLKTISITLIILMGIGALLSFVSGTPESERVVYRTVGDVSLTLDIYRPSHWKKTDRRPCVVWFFGGGWEVGSPGQFASHASHMAGAGFVSITPDYRVRSRHGKKTTPFDAVSDAMHAIAWAREHAGELGVDPSRIAAGGGSSGGHLAIICALLKDGKINEEFIAPAHPAAHHPDCLILFNPLLDFDIPAVLQRTTSAQRRNLEAISPIHLVDSTLPPTLILHGTADNIIPIATAEAFVAAAEKAGAKPVQLIRYSGKGHEFYLHGPGSGKAFKSAMKEVSEFLGDLGWNPENPTN